MRPFVLRACVLAALLPLLALAACDARADHGQGAAFDGEWEFDMTFQGDAMCAFEGLPLISRLRRGHAHGLYSEPNYGGWTYSATVQDDGVFALTLAGYAIVRLAGTLTGGTGQGSIAVSGTSLHCSGSWTARKLPQSSALGRPAA